jgi:hypothetical protein
MFPMYISTYFQGVNLFKNAPGFFLFLLPQISASLCYEQVPLGLSSVIAVNSRDSPPMVPWLLNRGPRLTDKRLHWEAVNLLPPQVRHGMFICAGPWWQRHER